MPTLLIHFVLAYVILTVGFKLGDIKLREIFDTWDQLVIFVVFSFILMVVIAYTLGFSPNSNLLNNIIVFLIALMVKSVVNYQE